MLSLIIIITPVVKQTSLKYNKRPQSQPNVDRVIELKRKKKLTFEYAVDDGHDLVIFAKHVSGNHAVRGGVPGRALSRENSYGRR